MLTTSKILRAALLVAVGSVAGAATIPVTGNNSSALQSAINQSKGQPGSCVLIPANSIIHIDANVSINFNNACLVGEGNTSVLVADGGTILVVEPQTSGYCYGFSGIEGDTSISSLSSCGFQPGQYLLIEDTSSVTPHQQVTQISSVSGGTLNLTTALAFDVDPTMRIQAEDMLSGVKIGNFAIVGGKADSLGKPLSVRNVVDSEFYNLTVTGMPCVGFKLDTGMRNRVHDMTFHGVASIVAGVANNDFDIFRETADQISNIQSYDAQGFGPVLAMVNYSNVVNVLSVHTLGRGFKLLGSNYNTLTNITVTNAGVPFNHSGIFFQTSSRNTLSQCESVHNATGVDLELGSNYNRISNCILRFSTITDIETSGAGHPPSSDHNVFHNVEYQILYDGGVGTLIYP
jgi:hypothetical protein